jgi:hypothetical protein
MKTTEEIDYGFKSKQQFHEKYALVNYEIRIKQAGYQNFIVPWQMVETEKKEVFVE